MQCTFSSVLVLAFEADLILAAFALAFAVAAVVAVLDLALDAGFLASPVTAYRHRRAAALRVNGIVRTFLAGTFLADVVFFALAAGFFVVVAFLEETATVFLTGTFLVVVEDFLVESADVLVTDLALGAALAVVYFFTVVSLAAALGLTAPVVAFLMMGLVFSLAASVRVLDASLILPEGPLGSWNMPFSLPEVIARLSWLAAMLLTSILYFFSTN